MSFSAENSFNQSIHTVRKSWTVFSYWTMDKPEMLKKHQLSILVQSIQRFVPKNMT